MCKDCANDRALRIPVKILVKLLCIKCLEQLNFQLARRFTLDLCELCRAKVNDQWDRTNKKPGAE